MKSLGGPRLFFFRIGNFVNLITKKANLLDVQNNLCIMIHRYRTGDKTPDITAKHTDI